MAKRKTLATATTDAAQILYRRYYEGRRNVYGQWMRCERPTAWLRS